METNELFKVDNKGKSNRALVKCLVCGAIFDSSIEICPVCKVGKDKFVPYEEDETSYINNTDESYVILGNGAAGMSAVKSIRERDKTCSIIMVSNEAVLSYNRPMLTKSLSEQLSAKQIAMENIAWYKRNFITNMLDTTVESINTEKKIIQLCNGDTLNYDKCIYALGAECFIPPIIGCNKPEVIAIRRILDVEKINVLLPNVSNVVVIGGGVLGLESAWELSKTNCKIAILEIADTLMGRQLDSEASALLGQIIKNVGIDFRLNAKICEITGEESVTGVKLDNGEFFPADLVIISSGIRTNSLIAKQAGIAVERGIVVNDKMETNASDIWACGDCAEYQGINYAIWSQALDMGKVAGANATGDAITYEIVPAALTFDGMNTSLYAIGDNGKDPTLQYKTVEFKDLENKTYEKYYFVSNHLVGVILIGDTQKLIQVTEAVNENRIFDKMF